MSWGDPYSKFYKDEPSHTRVAWAKATGKVPGALVKYGKNKGVMKGWRSPDIQSAPVNVPTPGLAIIVAACSTDAAAYCDWVMILTNHENTQFCWVPEDFVTTC